MGLGSRPEFVFLWLGFEELSQPSQPGFDPVRFERGFYGTWTTTFYGTPVRTYPRTPPLPTRHDAPSRAMGKQRATTTPFLRSKVEGTGSRGDGGPSAPAPPSTEFEDRRKKNDRTNEGSREPTEKKRGAFDFRTRGVSNYFLQLSLFRTVLETHRQPLTPTPPQSHRKNLLPGRCRFTCNFKCPP